MNVKSYKYGFIGLLFIMVGCSAFNSSPYYLVTGEKTPCDMVYENICIYNFSVNQNEIEKIISFIEEKKNPEGVSLPITRISLNMDSTYIEVITSSINYSYERKSGYGAVEKFFLGSKDDEFILINRELKFYEPTFYLAK